MDSLYQDCPAAAAEADDVTVPDHNDIRIACLDSALNSDNPTVVDAVSHICVLVRLVAGPDVQERLAERSVMANIGATHRQRIDRADIHAMIDKVLANNNLPAMLALDHFAVLARQRLR